MIFELSKLSYGLVARVRRSGLQLAFMAFCRPQIHSHTNTVKYSCILDEFIITTVYTIITVSKGWQLMLHKACDRRAGEFRVETVKTQPIKRVSGLEYPPHNNYWMEIKITFSLWPRFSK